MRDGKNFLIGDIPHISREYMRRHGIEDGAIRQDQRRDREKGTNRWSQNYIQYKDIPGPTKESLPDRESIVAEIELEATKSKLAGQNQKLREQVFRLNEAVSKWQKHRNQVMNDIRCKDLTSHEIKQVCRKVALYRELLVMKKEGVRGRFEAYQQVSITNYKKFKNDSSLSRKLTIAEQDVVGAILHQGRGNSNSRKTTKEHEEWIIFYSTIGKAYSPSQILERVNCLCGIYELNEISLSSVKRVRNIPNNHELIEVFDRDQSTRTTLKLALPLHAGDQYQVDEYKLEFYYDDERTNGSQWNTMYLFTVMDVYSRKIVAYNFNEVSDRWLFLSTLKMAVKLYGFLPHEIVSDNHSANQTFEVKDFKDALDKLEVTWTVDSNPRRKAVLERWHDTFQNSMKHYFGFKGGSPKDKRQGSRPAERLLKLYTKRSNVRDRNGLILLAMEGIERYNNTPLPKRKGKTPNELFKESKKPNVVPVDDETLINLFWLKAEETIRDSKVVFTRQKITHEYPLAFASHEIRQQWNNQKVIVCYDEKDYSEIFILDPSNRRLITSLKEMPNLHGDKANQTKEDLDYMAKIAAKDKAYNNHLKQQIESLGSSIVSRITPDASHYMTHGKEVARQAEDIYMRNELMEIQGIDPDNIKPINEKSDLELSPATRPILARQEKEGRAIKNAFKGDRNLSIYIPDEEDEE
ncbi:integrase catalytic domain-containing protein [Tunicatimonas pelagia]|uniref:integrase catalytic domain-containing protein n=1 Tax=Tunicatimonas pelagia TaxID=931531 RepID=UPI0026650291|nr:transposase family protein [Tunicatimonas pelagia]WKN42200.1 transposase family protein [Tunicatimonas pelagia]WKN45318.1 transposase family protein [Tunicatimonas pelagia]